LPLTRSVCFRFAFAGLRRGASFKASRDHTGPIATVLQQTRFLGGIIWKQAGGMLRPEPRNTHMKNKLGAVVLLSLLYAQGLLGVAAVAAVLMKEPPKQHVAAQSAAVEGLVSVQ
jgi:hypothetical protein